MAHVIEQSEPLEPRMLGKHTYPLFRGGMLLAGISLLVAMVAAWLSHDGLTRFFFAYVVNFAFFLSIALGALFFVLIQHLTRSGWSASVRRVAEVLAASVPMLAAAFAPVLIAVVGAGLMSDVSVYPWAKTNAAHHEVVTHGEHDQVADASHSSDESHQAKPYVGIDPHTEAIYSKKKAAYLNPVFFTIRWVVYFLIWSWLGLHFWRKSLKQDDTGDPGISVHLTDLSAPAMWLFALSLTFASFDLLMSLSPAWYSTIFGVYYFSGCVVASVAVMILILRYLETKGPMAGLVTVEHYHDLGKLLFAFTFFWGYIAFSQYMLIWYASLPETVFWFEVRGATTRIEDVNGWSWVTLILLFGHFIVPFAVLLTRHTKRRVNVLVVFAIWMLVFHWVDLWWLVMPELGPSVRLGIPEIATFLGVGGLYFAMVVRLAGSHSVVARRDPRLAEALAFENI